MTYARLAPSAVSALYVDVLFGRAMAVECRCSGLRKSSSSMCKVRFVSGTSCESLVVVVAVVNTRCFFTPLQRVCARFWRSRVDDDRVVDDVDGGCEVHIVV
jgi:hypothetical protein